MQYVIEFRPALASLFGYRIVSHPTLAKLEKIGEAKLTEVLPAEQQNRDLPINIQDASMLSSVPFFGRSFRSSLEQVVSPVSVVVVRNATVLTSCDEWGNHSYSAIAPGPRILPIAGTSFVSFNGKPPGHSEVQKVPSAGWFLEYWATNHYHWLARMLPKALLLRRFCPEIPLLLPSNGLLDPVKRRSLSAIGFNGSSVLECDLRPLCVDSMAFISSDLADGRLHRELRDQVISTVVGPISESRRRLYISRRRAKWRKILNEASLVEALGAYGFEVVECEKLTFDEQVRTFSHAEVIVGAHGAGLANMMFSPPGAKVLEIAHPQWPNPDYFVLAANLGLDYCIEMGRPAGIAAPAYDHIEVDLTSLCKTLDNFF